MILRDTLTINITIHEIYNFTPTILEKHDGRSTWSTRECFALTLRSLVTLGSDNVLDTAQKKLITVSMMLGGMILYVFWDSTLICYLTLPKRDFPFHSMKEFYTNSDQKVNCLCNQMFCRYPNNLRIVYNIIYQ